MLYPQAMQDGHDPFVYRVSFTVSVTVLLVSMTVIVGLVLVLTIRPPRTSFLVAFDIASTMSFFNSNFFIIFLIVSSTYGEDFHV